MLLADRLDDDQRWSAVKARDPRFDGTFIVGVRTTGIYCRPSCPTPIQPLRKNVDFHRTTASAQRAGLRACKRCRPDASPGSPEWSAREDLVGRAMRSISDGRLNGDSVDQLARDLGVTARHLRRVLTEEVGAPPLALARANRAQTARTLIETTTMPFAEVAFGAGFQSLRQFNDTVREVFASTPTELRRRRNPDRSAPGCVSLRLPFRGPLDTDHLFGFHARRAIPQCMVGDESNQTLLTALRLPGGPSRARLSVAEGWIEAHMELAEIADLALAVRQCRSLLDLDADPVHIDRTLVQIRPLAHMVQARPGVRSPGTTDPFATLIFAVLGQQRSVAAARTLATRIEARCSGFDPREGNPNNSDDATEEVRPFPTAEQVAEVDLGDLGLTSRNQATIKELGRRVVDGSLDLGPHADRGAVRSRLIEVKGIGPWTADYALMRALGAPDVHLKGDLVADRQATEVGLTRDDFEAARPWRSYLTHRLWQQAGQQPPSQKTPQPNPNSTKGRPQ